MRVSARVVLHEIARHEDRVGYCEVAGRVRERALERFERVDAAQRAGGVAEQVRIGELDDTDGAHSNGLYKHAAAQRVMRVTPRISRCRGVNQVANYRKQNVNQRRHPATRHAV